MTETMTADERHALIEKLQAEALLMAIDTQKRAFDIRLTEADTHKREQDIRHGPWLLAASILGGGAALIGAGAALFAVLLKWVQH